MAALPQVSSRSVLREEAGGTSESPVTMRTPVPAVSPGSPEILVLPAQVAEPPGKNLWEQICEGRRPPLAGPSGTLAGSGQDAGGTHWEVRSKPLCARRVTRAGGLAELRRNRLAYVLDSDVTTGNRLAEGNRVRELHGVKLQDRDPDRPQIVRGNRE